ncbi:MAG TPA: SUMF1/EgtB/PvdO family nonheme iron enzyme [Blastocatellia bacterium]
MPTPNLQLEDLLDLREELRNAGFDPGVQRAIAAHNLLLALAAQGRLPADPHDWRTWLAPVFCSTAKEQEEFYRRYPGWVARHLDLAASASRVKDTAARTAAAETLPENRVRSSAFRRLLAKLNVGRLKAELRTWLRRIARPQVWATALAVLVVLAGLGWIWLRRQEASRNNPINPPEEQTTPKPKPAGFELADNDPPATPQPSPTPITPPSRFSLKAWQIALILAPFVLFTLWLLWRWLSRQALLQRLPDNKLPQLHDLKVEGIEGKLFASARLRRLLLGLRRPRPMAMRELNIPATVRETIRQGGMFTPAYGARRSSPEYLLLIDRASAHDEQANVANELRLRLVENGVFVESYYFQSDARSCRSATKDEASVSLSQLAGRYPDHRLLVFSDAAGFFDPFTGRPQRWLEQFTPWEQRVLLTPEAPAQWGARERELARREFVLLPASVSGIEELGEWLNYGMIPAPETSAARPFPEVIEERPQRWLERQKPLPDELEELSAQVRDYLGQDGWDWLAACAVYPEITWELTLYHGYWLFGGDEQWREAWAERVLRLVRLPWFRYGSMPNWWREHLLESFSRNRESVVRQGIERLLRSALNPDEPVTLEYAEQEKQRLRQRVTAWWQRQRLYWGLRTVEPEEPLRDYVFLRFLSGQRPKRLSVSVPAEILRRLLFKDGQPALGLRPLTMFLLTSTASLALLYRFVEPSLNLQDPAVPSVLAIATPTVPPNASLTPPPVRTPSPTVSPAITPTPVRGPGTPQIGELAIDPQAQQKTLLNIRERQDGHMVELANNLTLDLVALPGGAFMMGSDKGSSDEQPVHRVQVAPFYIGRTEVTQAQWQAVMGSLPDVGFKGAERPVERVSWNDARDFCERLSQLTGKKFRLPTEAEWEYAARGGKTTEYSFGNDQEQLGLYAWYGENSDSQTHPVAKKLANPFGLFDMHGNVWEWCEDVWHKNSEKAPSDGSAWLSGGDSTFRVLRGGSWNDFGYNCRSAVRVSYGPGLRNLNVGFRVVVSARTSVP